MSLILVRHAHAGSRREWAGDDRVRPLSRRGEQQADRIAEQLAGSEPARIMSSPATRCRQTVEPLAERTHLEVMDDDRLFEGASRSQVRSLIDEVGAETVVVCSHGDVIPELLRELVDLGARHEDPLRWQKASIWIVERDGAGRWGTARYIAPPR